MPLKTANIEQAEAASAAGDFVYNNPCSKCGKECSTPTKDIWKRRIDEFGSVRAMYEKYKCRGCRKADKGTTPQPVPLSTVKERAIALTPPAVADPAATPAPCTGKEELVYTAKKRKPGDRPPSIPPNSLGVSVFECGVFQYTQWISDIAPPIGTPPQPPKEIEHHQ